MKTHPNRSLKQDPPDMGSSLLKLLHRKQTRFFTMDPIMVAYI